MRRFWVIILAALLLAACHRKRSDSDFESIRHNDTITKASERKEIAQKEYSDKEVAELTALLDSIHHLDLHVHKQEILHPIDSTFRAIKNLNKTLSDEDYRKLKNYCDSGMINLDFAKRIFPFKINSTILTEVDSEYIAKENQIFIYTYNFSDNSNDRDEFAVCLGYSWKWWNDTYFFKKNKIIAWQRIYHRYGLVMKSFKDMDSKTVVYYQANFGSGTGLYQFNTFFYKYMDDRLIPVLNVTSEGHDCFFGPIYQRQLDAKIIKEQPLTIQYSRNITLGDKGQYPDIDTTIFYQDSAVIVFDWDKKSKSFKAHDSSVSIDELLVDYFPYDSQSYCIFQDYYSKFKAILNGPKGMARNNVLLALSELKEREKYK